AILPKIVADEATAAQVTAPAAQVEAPSAQTRPLSEQEPPPATAITAAGAWSQPPTRIRPRPGQVKEVEHWIKPASPTEPTVTPEPEPTPKPEPTPETTLTTAPKDVSETGSTGTEITWKIDPADDELPEPTPDPAPTNTPERAVRGWFEPVAPLV